MAATLEHRTTSTHWSDHKLNYATVSCRLLITIFATLTSFWSADWIIAVHQSPNTRPPSVTVRVTYLVSSVERRNVGDSDSYKERDEAYHKSLSLAYAMDSSHLFSSR